MKAEQWNERFGVGQPVFLTEDDGSVTNTQTRSVAWELANGQSIVKVGGKTGGYSLGRICARPTKFV